MNPRKTWKEWFDMKPRYRSILFCIKKYPRSLYYKWGFKDAEQFLKSEGFLEFKKKCGKSGNI